jgi:MFS family permease
MGNQPVQNDRPLGSTRRVSSLEMHTTDHLSMNVDISEQRHTIRLKGVNEALEYIGMGKFQWLLLGYTSFANAADAAETMVLSFLGPSAVCQFDASPAQESALTSVVFVGMLVGVYALGSMSDVYGRRTAFLVSAILLGLAGVASALAPSFLVLVLCRMIVGAGLGGVPIAITLFAEWVPSAKRGAFSLLMQSSWALGSAGQALLAWAILGSLGWRWFLFLSALPLFALSLGYPWLPESPFWLISKQRYGEAEDIVEKIATYNLVSAGNLSLEFKESQAGQKDDTISIGLEQQNPVTKLIRGVRGAFRTIFSGHLSSTTPILWLVWFANAATYYGLVLFSTSLQQESDGTDTKRCNGSEAAFSSYDYFAVFITAVSEAPGLIVAALLVDMKGRLWCLRAGMMICAISIFGLLLGGRIMQLVLLFIARAAIEGTFSVLYVYTPELYPTEVRSLGLATCNGCARLGGFSAPFFTVYLIENGLVSWSIILLGVICTMAFTSCLFLSVETAGSDLGRPEVKKFKVEEEEPLVPQHP